MSWNSVDYGEEEYCCQLRGNDGWGPGGCDGHHERDRSYDSDPQPAPEPAPPPRVDNSWPDYGDCPTTGLRNYPNEATARQQAVHIKEWCERSGRHWNPLTPEKCTVADHWHLRYA